MIERQRSANHEVAHALYGWAQGFEVHGIRVFANGGGETEMTFPLSLYRLAEAGEYDPECTTAQMRGIIGCLLASTMVEPLSNGLGDRFELNRWRQQWEIQPWGEAWQTLSRNAMHDVHTWMKQAMPALAKIARHVEMRGRMSGMIFGHQAKKLVGPPGYLLHEQLR